MNDSFSLRDHSRRYSLIDAPLPALSSQLMNVLVAERQSANRFRGDSGIPGPEITSRYSDQDPG